MIRKLSYARSYYQKKLTALLEVADEEGFVQLLWAANMLQSDGEKAAAPYLNNKYPKDSVTTDMTDSSFIYKWELETIANELLVTPKSYVDKRGRSKRLIINNYNNIVQVCNYLRKLENAESAHGLSDKNIFRELARIANRQFDWQRGFLNIPQFYRNAYIYGQGACSAYFEDKHGITVNQLSLVGFGIHTQLTNQPTFNSNSDLSFLGISQNDLKRALALISVPIHDAKEISSAERKGIYHAAYRPSLFRRYPCLRFGSNVIRSPLPQIIIERVTSGIFYDVIGGGGDIRNEYGKRFEDYSFNYLKAIMPELHWEKEKKYRVKPNLVDTPDILLSENGVINLVIECKATRMGYSAKFGDGEIYQRGFDDLIKAVFQIWRFFSHCRRGFTGFSVGHDAVGAVLTLENWFAMAGPLQDDVLRAAEEMATKRDPNIIRDDQKPVSFFSITEMESSLRRATADSFLEAIRASANPEHHGYMLNTIHNKLETEQAPNRPYPFKAEMGEVLPWWNMVEKELRRRANVHLATES